jgi:hypothetical protein
MPLPVKLANILRWPVIYIEGAGMDVRIAMFR